VAEKNTAVRAFCTATSQLKRVVLDEVQNVPSTVGATPSELGLLTTVMKTWAAWPRGRRMPARVVRQRFAAATSMLETSIAVSRAPPPGRGVDTGSFMSGWRSSPVSPPRVMTGYGNAGGVVMSVYGATGAPGRLPKGSTAPRLVVLSMYSRGCRLRGRRNRR